MKHIIRLLAILLSNTIFCQTNSWNAFIAAGYVILDSVGGDLNRDGLRDMALILLKDGVSSDAAGSRPLLILHGQKDGSFKLSERNDSVIPGYAWGGSHGDPYQKITVNGNCFTLEFFGGYGSSRWSRTVTFRYELNKKDYFLHEDKGESWNQIYDTDKTEKQLYNKQQWDKTRLKNYVVK